MTLSTVLCRPAVHHSPPLAHQSHLLAAPIFQFISAAYGVSVTDAILPIFLKNPAGHMGTIDGRAVLNVDAGAGALEGAFEGDLIRGVPSAYLAGLYTSWALAIALFGVMFICALLPTGVGKLSPEKAVDEKNSEEDAAVVRG